jgi:hypothetical protein
MQGLTCLLLKKIPQYFSDCFCVVLVRLDTDATNLQRALGSAFGQKNHVAGLASPLIAGLCMTYLEQGNINTLLMSITKWRTPVKYYYYIYLGVLILFIIAAKLTTITIPYFAQSTWYNHIIIFRF